MHFSNIGEVIMKNRSIAILLAIFLGGLGMHRFYLDRPGQGIFYLIFCWTLVPWAIALFEAFIWLVNGEKYFHERYSPDYIAPEEEEDPDGGC